MADAFRGLTIRLGADARPLNSAINSIKSSASQAQKQLTAMNKALKFDKHNVDAMRASLDLVNDKAMLTARAAANIRVAMSQVDHEIKGMASRMKDVYANTQMARAEYVSVDAELQQIYDHAAKVVKKMSGLSETDAVNYVKLLREQMRGTGEAANKARNELRNLISQAAGSNKLSQMFNLAKGDAEGLLMVYDRLVGEHKKFNAALEKAKAVEGYKAMETQLVAYEAELRQAAMEATRLNAELYELGAGEGVAKSLSKIERIDAAIDDATASARKMNEVFKSSPNDISAAAAKMKAAANQEELMREKAKELKAILSSMQKNGIDELANDVKNVHKWFSEATHDAADFRAQLNGAEEYLKLLNRQMKKMKKSGVDEASEDFQKLKGQIKEAEVQVGNLKGKLNKANAELKKASEVRAYLRHTEDLRVLESELTQATSKASALRRALDLSKNIRTMGYGLYSTITPAIMMAGRYAIQSARDIDSAYRDMRKTVNGTEEQFESLLDDALKFSTTHFTSADQMLEIEAMGGQLGIAADDLGAFAETVANLDIATNIDADAAAEQLGKMATVLGITESEYDNFGDALVRLGNNMPVLEGDITTLMTRFMGMGKVVGMQPDQMLAWAAAASATGQKAEAAGSSMQRFISNMETAVVGGGENLEKWAAVAGMSGEEFARAFGEDASNAMYKFVQGLGEIQKQGGSVNQVLKDLKINNVRDKQLLEGLAVQMANAKDGPTVLGEALRMASDAYHGLATTMKDGSIEEAGDAAREAGKKAEGFSGQIEQMVNTAKVFSQELAKGALPYVQILKEMFLGLTEAFSKMPDSMKAAIVGIVGAIAGLGPAFVAFGAVGSFVDTILEICDKAVAAKTLEKVSGGFTAVGSSLNKIASKGGIAGKAATNLGVGLLALEAVPFPVIVAGLAAVAGVIATIASYSVGVAERSNKMKAATEDYVAAAKSAKGAADILALGTGAYSNSIDDVLANTEKYVETAEKMKDKSIELADSFREQQLDAETNAALIQKYSDTIVDLAGNCKGSQKDLAVLKNAIAQYNELTGAGVTMVNEFSGAIDRQTDAITANTEAAKLNAYEKAYSEMLSEAVKHQEETRIAYETQTQALAEIRREMKSLEDSGEAWTFGASGQQEYSDRMLELQSKATELTNTTSDLTKEMEANGQVVDSMTDKYAEVSAAANGNTEAAQRMRYAVMDYEKALNDANVSFDQFLDGANSLDMSVSEFAATLSGAGISAQDFANMGKEGFDNLLAAAQGDLTQLATAVELLNQANINPKNMVVTEEGIEDAEGKLWQLDLAAGTITNGEKVIHIGADTSSASAAIQGAEAEGATYDEQTYTSEADADNTEAMEGFDEAESEGESYDTNTYTASAALDTSSAYSSLSSLQSSLETFANTTYTAGISAAERASGGFTKLHADGGFVTNGPTALGFDRFGTLHIAGEAGREWIKRHADGTTSIVPIENRRYLKPYAREIAGMIGGAGTTNYYITLDYKAGDDANKIVRDLGFALRTSAMMEG